MIILHISSKIYGIIYKTFLRWFEQDLQPGGPLYYILENSIFDIFNEAKYLR